MAKAVKDKKRPVGRPKDEDPKIPVPLRLRMSTTEIVKKVAEKEDRSLSYILERAIEEKYL